MSTNSKNRDLCIMACVFCKDPQFQRWVRHPKFPPATEGEAKAFILDMCRVESRNELDTNPDAAERFHELVRKPFLEWEEGQ